MDVLGQLSNLKNLADGQKELIRSDRPPTLYVQNQRRLKQDQIQELINAYQQGAGTTQLTSEYGIHRTTLWGHLDRAGIPRKPAKRKLSDTQVRTAAIRYSLGLSLKAVAAEFGVNAETLRREFIKAGLPRRRGRLWSLSER